VNPNTEKKNVRVASLLSAFCRVLPLFSFVRQKAIFTVIIFNSLV
jgi:hypothetical protein